MEKKKSFRERLLNLGVGSFFYAKEKAGKVISDIEAKGEENKDNVGDIGGEIKTNCKKGVNFVQKLSGKVFSSVGIATKKDIDELKNKIKGEKK